MIKLKSLLCENDYVDVVDHMGHIRGVKITDPVSGHSEHGFIGGNGWRFYGRYFKVVWDKMPSIEEVYRLHDWLYKKLNWETDYYLPTHYVLGSNDPIPMSTLN